MVPNGWSVFPLDQVSKIIDCKHRTPKYVKEGIPLVSPGTIKWGPIDLDSPTKRVTNEEYTSLMDHCSVDIGDLVLSRNQSVGIASYVDKSEPFVLGQDTVLVKPNGCDASYLFYNLQSVNTQRTLFKLAGGSTFSRINLGEIRKLRSIYPPLPEQRKIAQILSTWDRGIATTEKLIDASKQQKKALMQQLLTGKKRLVDPETGKAFERDWEEVRLDSFITNFIVPMRDKPKDLTGEIPWCRIEDFSGMYLSKSKSNQGVSLATIEDMNLKVFPKDTLLVSCSADLGRCAITQNELVTNQTFIGLVTNKQVSDVRFLFYKIIYFAKKLNDLSSGTTISYLSRKEFEKFKVSQPAIEEQRKIASVLIAADKDIELLEAKLAHFKQEKKALMQQLLTGKRRVMVTETEAA